MTPEQKQWLSEHEQHKSWRPQGFISMYSWADVGYLYPSGQFVPEGRSFWLAASMHLMSLGDTLHVVPKDSIKVGRECAIC